MPLSPRPFPAAGLIPTSSPATSPSRPSLSHWVLAASSLHRCPWAEGRLSHWPLYKGGKARLREAGTHLRPPSR